MSHECKGVPVSLLALLDDFPLSLSLIFTQSSYTAIGAMQLCGRYKQ